MFATINDLKIHYEISGQKPGTAPWVTLSHSLASSMVMWKPQLELLEHSFSVLRYDTRGHGGTQTTSPPYSLEQLADDIRGLLAHLGIQKTHWLGLSVGGMIGQVLAINHPTCLDKVIIANSNSQVAPPGVVMWNERAQSAKTSGMQPLVAPTLARWFTEPFHISHPQVLREIGDIIASTNPEGYAGCCAAISNMNNIQGIKKLSHPALVVVGLEDTATPLAMSQIIHENWQGSILKTIPHAAHLSNLEQAGVFNELIIEFLKGI